MKNINQYILEKFKLNSDNIKKSLPYFTENILRILYQEIDDVSKEEIKLISEWEKIAELEDLIIVTTSEVLEKYQLIDPDNNVTLKDVLDKFENDNIKFTLSGSLYDKYKKLNGELKYKDQYEHNKYYICSVDNDYETLILKFESRFAGCIIFCPGTKTIEKYKK